MELFDSVKVPEPAFTKLPAPLIIPEIVRLFVSPVVNVIPLANSTFPEPKTDATVFVESTSNTPSLSTVVLDDKVPVT